MTQTAEHTIPLNGLYDNLAGLYADIERVSSGSDLDGITDASSPAEDEASIYRYLVRSRNVIMAKPEMFQTLKNPREVARMLDYAIQYFYTPSRERAIDIVAGEEERLLGLGIIYYPPVTDLSDDDLEGLGDLGDLGKGFFKKIGAAIKKVAKKVVDVHKKVAKKVVEGHKKVFKAVVKVAKKINPVRITMRAFVLKHIRANKDGMADNLQYGLYTDEQARAAGLDMAAFHDNQTAYKKSVDKFVSNGGDKKNFDAAIRSGIRNKAINGISPPVGDLGDLGADWSKIAEVAGKVIQAIIGFFKGLKNPKTGKTDTSPLPPPPKLDPKDGQEYADPATGQYAPAPTGQQYAPDEQYDLPVQSSGMNTKVLLIGAGAVAGLALIILIARKS
ncbi:hypothetical protein FACS189464_1670 [Bacteroidia bacterium]|nr:hypothetical protein FACS189464_1670 [Bacteroidia bacterium]